MQIKEVQVGSRLEGCFILDDAYAKVSSAGKPFLSVVLRDGTGTIDGKVWDYAGPISPREKGQILWIRGTVTQFRGENQVNIDQLRLAEEGEYDPARLVPSAPIDIEKGYGELLGLIDSMEDKDYAALCRLLLDRYREQFIRMPAGKSVHHSFLSGLLMHTLYMVRTADFLAGQYGEIIDRSLLLSGVILHDLAKCQEFVTSSLGLVTEYSTQGQLIGHLVMGAQLIADAARELSTPEEKSLLLQHLVLSHHGEPEFGAAVLPQCAESELLSAIDRLDSRMEIYREAMAETPKGTFSKRIFALDHKIYHHP